MTADAFAGGLMFRLFDMAQQAEGSGRRQGSDGGRRVACVAGHVDPGRPGVSLGDDLRTVAVATGSPSLMVPLVATRTGSGRVHWRHCHRLPMTVNAMERGVALMAEGNRPFPVRLSRGGDGDADPDGLGEAGRLVALSTIGLAWTLVMAELAAARRLEGEHRLGAAKVAGKAGQLRVPGVRKCVARQPGEGTEPRGAIAFRPWGFHGLENSGAVSRRDLPGGDGARKQSDCGESPQNDQPLSFACLTSRYPARNGPLDRRRHPELATRNGVLNPREHRLGRRRQEGPVIGQQVGNR
jgi:hypothetical protein